MGSLTISKEIECENCRCKLEVDSGIITCPNCNSSWPLPKGLWDALTGGRVKIEHEQNSSQHTNKHNKEKKQFLRWLRPGVCVHCGSEFSSLFRCKSCNKSNWRKGLLTYCAASLITLSGALIVDYVKPIVYLQILGDYETINERGREYALNNNYSKAIKHYNTALKISPGFYEAILNRGEAYDNKGSHDLAIADFNTALEIKPKDDKALNGRGSAYRNKGNNDKAIADFDAAIKIRPDNHVYLSNRGNAYRNKGNYDLAIADFDAAIKIKPDDPNVLNSRGDVYRRKGDYERASADYVVAQRVVSSHEDDGRKSEADRSKKRRRQ